MNLIPITMHGYQFYMELENDFVAASLHRGEVWETTALGEWVKCCKNVSSTGIIMDVGAYTGIYSILAAKATEGALIFAYEPLPSNFKRTVYNLIANDVEHRVDVLNTALSDKNGTSVLNITGSSQLPSGSSVDLHPSKRTLRTETISLTRGDDFFAPYHRFRVELIKMDVERHEYAVIRGLEQTLIKDKPTVFMEILSTKEFLKIHQVMKDYGYTSVELICEDLRETVSDDRVQTPVDGLRTNYIFR